MQHESPSQRSVALFCGIAGLAGVVMLGVSFNLNPGPPPNATSAELMEFGRRYFSSILWGAWLQAVGPVLMVCFALGLVCLAGAMQRLSGWMTLFGASVLMTVSLVEIGFYISALNADPPGMPFVSLRLISAVQHLYFIVASPALFLPLGVVLLGSSVLPRLFGYLAILLGVGFAVLGIATLHTLILPGKITALGGVQAIWWLAAAIALTVRSVKMPA